MRARALLGLLFLLLLAESTPRGSAATPPASQACSPALLHPQNPIVRFHLHLNQTALSSLRRDPRRQVGAQISINDQPPRPVRLHLKGRAGSFRPIEDKPGFTLHLPAGDPGPLVFGLNKWHLNNAVEDETYLHEWLGSQWFQNAGVPAPTVAHAVVCLNQRDLGLYVLKEGITERWLARHFSRGDGPLYDTEHGHDLDQPLHRQRGRRTAENQADLDRLVAIARTPDLSQRWEQLDTVLDRSAFVRFLAMEVLVGHWDGYSLNQNNFLLYHDPGRNRFTFLPTGMDQLFGKTNYPWQPSPSGLLARAVLETPDGVRAYRDSLRQQLAAVDPPTSWSQRLRERLALFQRVLPAAAWKQTREAAEAWIRQIEDRIAFLQAQIAAATTSTLLFSPGNEPIALSRWLPDDVGPSAHLERITSVDGSSELRIEARAATAAAWRTRVRLPRGRYRFAGRVELIDFQPLRFGQRSGAQLRVAGQPGVLVQNAAPPGTTVHVDLVVHALEQDLDLLCELRARAGQARFLENSLRLKRME